MATNHGGRRRDVLRPELREQVRRARHFVEERERGPVRSRPLAQEVIELGEDEGREDQRRLLRFEDCPAGGREALIRIQRLEQAAGVEEDQSSPKPSSAVSQSSIGSTSPGSNRGSLGRGGTRSRTYASSAARITSASLRFSNRAVRVTRCLRSSGRYTVVFTIAVLPYTYHTFESTDSVGWSPPP